MSTLTNIHLRKYLKEDTLIVTPLLSEDQIGQISIDVRLGNQFVVFRSHRLGIFEPFSKIVVEPRKVQERQIIRFGDNFILHPGVLILGCTFEYISIPNNLECQVEGRSSWARLGLQVVTASSIEPGFKGVVTLELSNVGTVPLTLMPGIRIAQLVFRTADPPIKNPYSGKRKYKYPIGPEFSLLYNDYDWKIISDHKISAEIDVH